MTARKNTQKSPVDLAAQHIEEVENAISSLTDEIGPLAGEREQLLEKVLLSPSDVDRLAEIEQGSLPRREEYLQKLRETVLPEAIADLRRLELLALAEDGVDGIEAKYAGYQRRITEAEEKAAQAITEAREAVEEWNSFIRPVLAVALEAGQDRANPADPDHPVQVEVGTLSPQKGKPLYLILDGTNYHPAGGDRTVRTVVGRADKHVAVLIREAVEQRDISEGQRIQAFNR